VRESGLEVAEDMLGGPRVQLCLIYYEVVVYRGGSRVGRAWAWLCLATDFRHELAKVDG
jgi:hypothetical protein